MEFLALHVERNIIDNMLNFVLVAHLTSSDDIIRSNQNYSSCHQQSNREVSSFR